jgi:cyclophilin family peptidyl-prolyl cis-trans isomerase
MMRTALTICLIALAVLTGCEPSGFVSTPAPAEPVVVDTSDQAPAADPQPAAGPNVIPIVIETSRGTIRAELWADKAPVTVENFLTYVDEGFFDGTVFHRVMPGFMIQGGGFTPDLNRKPTYGPIRNEARRDVPNDRGTLAMARTNQVHSATSQFFINVEDNDFLNYRSATPEGYGYAVFGKVTEGMDVVDAIVAVPTRNMRAPNGMMMECVPDTPIMIESIRRADD